MRVHCCDWKRAEYAWERAREEGSWLDHTVRNEGEGICDRGAVRGCCGCCCRSGDEKGASDRVGDGTDSFIHSFTHSMT